MIEKNDLYDYGLKIYQNSNYFKFSLDSILLGEYVSSKRGDKILDLCTGNAPIPLILSTRYDNIKIDAVEIQREVYELATLSVRENGLEDVITIYEGDAKSIVLPNKYDICVANPPYFKVTSSSQKNKDKIKQIARHEVEITLEELIASAKRNLVENGRIYLVHRCDRFLETIDLLRKHRFGIREAVFVYTKDKNDAEFFLIEASKCKKNDMKVKSLFVKDLSTYKDIFKEG